MLNQIKTFLIGLQTRFVSKEIIMFGLFLTIVNIGYFVLLKDVSFFVARQIFIFAFLLIKFNFREEISSFSKDHENITKLLRKKFPILRFQGPLMMVSFISVILFQRSYLYPELWPFSFFLLSIIFFYIVLLFCSVFYIFKTPEVLDYYNIVKAVKTNGFRSYSTAAKIAHTCLLCLKGRIGVSATTWIGPKILMGDPLFRGSLWNTLTFPYTGLIADNEEHIVLASRLRPWYPNVMEKVLMPDGVTVNPQIIVEEAAKRNIYFSPPVFREFPLWSPYY